MLLSNISQSPKTKKKIKKKKKKGKAALLFKCWFDGNVSFIWIKLHGPKLNKILLIAKQYADANMKLKKKASINLGGEIYLVGQTFRPPT